MWSSSKGVWHRSSRMYFPVGGTMRNAFFHVRCNTELGHLLDSVESFQSILEIITCNYTLEGADSRDSALSGYPSPHPAPLPEGEGIQSRDSASLPGSQLIPDLHPGLITCQDIGPVKCELRQDLIDDPVLVEPVHVVVPRVKITPRPEYFLRGQNTHLDGLIEIVVTEQSLAAGGQ